MHASLSIVLIAALLLGAALAVLARLRRRRLRPRPDLLPPGPAPDAGAPPAAMPCRDEAQAEQAGPVPSPSVVEPPPEMASDPAPPAEEGIPPHVAAPLVLLGERRSLAIPRAVRGPTRYPVVLAHGFGGFDDLAFRGRRIAYFRGVSERLHASGVDVHVLRVSPLARIASRAEQLAAQIERLGVDRVNIIAHSMGGLDARYAIARLGMAHRVASLITIGTPHRGTPLADLGTMLLSCAFGKVPTLLGAVHDLCPRQMALFNEEVDDAPGVAYGCIVTAARRGASRVNALLLPGYLFLRQRAGDNDGVVPVSSQRWGAIWGEIDVDHWGAVGWSSAFDAAAFYERLARDLGRRGF